MVKSRIGALFFLIFSAFYFYKSFDIHLLSSTLSDVMTARTFPYYLGILGMIISILILIFSFTDLDKTNDLLDMEKLRTYDFKKGMYLIVTMIFYGYTIRSLGFLISTIIFLILGFKILEEKSWKVILLTSFSVSIVFWLLLTQLLGIYVENGVIFEYFLGAQS
ncbi:MAG: tripartite tricarboxylate transporter TctB family protein [Campylobacteraceae bacterium]|nr:tripartite tricarboxylate transporter TctB family protein [Campylobacteraceae bacterium]